MLHRSEEIWAGREREQEDDNINERGQHQCEHVASGGCGEKFLEGDD